MSCELMKCGHCKSLEEDDQCGKPEHRFCGLCALKEASDESDTWASRMYDAIETVVKAGGLPASAVEILNKAAHGPVKP